MYQYGGCYQQPCAPTYCGGGSNGCGLAIILVLFILLVVAGCGVGNCGGCGWGC